MNNPNILNKLTLMDKKDYEKLLINLCEDPLRYISEEKASIAFPNITSADYKDSTQRIESFARLLWGLGPYGKWNSDSELLKEIETGVINGTNPTNPEYWGRISDYDQVAVEMPPIALYLYYTKDKFWKNLDINKKTNIQNWLLQINDIKTGDNNWLLFSVIVNAVLKEIGVKYDANQIKENLESIEKFYLGQGWYSDGKSNRRDYYTSFAIHYYSLIYAKLVENDQPNISNLFKKRAEKFGKDFIYWFSDDGSAIPFGRSLTYRFAQVAFWSAVIYAGVEIYSIDVIKGIINRNLRWWLSQPIFTEMGLLSIGYAYPNINISESYNGTGSPYWALKSFLVLALDENNDFWTTSESDLPKLENTKFIKEARMTICRKSNHVVAFVNGQDCENQVHSVSKYEKFCYSNLFGFSVPRSNFRLNESGFDSTLSICEGENYFITRSNIECFKNEPNIMYSKWKPLKGVMINSYILPNLPWHIRIHEIYTERTITLIDAGYSIQKTENSSHKMQLNDGILTSNGEYFSGIKSFIGNGFPEIVSPVPNTNVLYSKTEVPTLSWRLRPGKYLIVNGVFGDNCNGNDISLIMKSEPEIFMNKNHIRIILNESEICIDLSQKLKSRINLKKKILIYKKKVKKYLRKTLKEIRW